VIDQIPKMNSFDFISNLGGNFGLFIGISILSFAEFIELFIEIILIFFKRDNSLVQFQNKVPKNKFSLTKILSSK
jgi:hypothetical protein